MEALIVAGACAVAKWVTEPTKSRKSPNVPISPNKEPNAPLIYGGDRLRTVDAYVRDLAGEKHRERIKQQYPDSYDKPPTVQPSDPMGFQDSLGSIGAPVNFDTHGPSAAKSFEQNQQASVASNPTIAPYDPQKGLPIAKKSSNSIDDSPMFRDFKFNDTPNRQAPVDPNGKEISFLTGQPIETFHGNMQPFYKGTLPPSPDDLQSNARLESMTGVDNGMGLIRPLKREVENAMPNTPQDIRKADGSYITGQRNRVLASIKPSYDYMSPVRSTRDAPINSHSIRVLPNGIDKTRSVMNQQKSYQTPLVGGQKGTSRAPLPNARVNRWDLTKEKGITDMFPTKSAYSGNARLILPTVRNLNSTRTTSTNGYVGTPTNVLLKNNVDLQHANIRTGFNERINDRESFTPSLGIATATLKLSGPKGQLRLRLPDKGFKMASMGAPFFGKGAMKYNVVAPNVTLNDMLATSLGPANPTGRQMNIGYLNNLQNVQVPMTTKAMTSNNNYISLPRWSLGNGARNHEFTPWSTEREMNLYSTYGRGNVYSDVQANPIMGHLESNTNREMQGEISGGPRNLYNAPQQHGQLLDEMPPETLVSDYYANPRAPIQAPRMRTDIDNISFKEVIDFGGYYHHGKTGNGQSTNRDQLMRIKNDQSVEGRMNVGLSHDNLGQPDVQIEICDDIPLQNREGMLRVQPTAVTVNHNPISIRSANKEAMNPRLDPSIKITSDLFPFVQGGNAQHIF